MTCMEENRGIWMTEGQIKAIEAVDTIIRYIESIDGDLREVCQGHRNE